MSIHFNRFNTLVSGHLSCIQDALRKYQEVTGDSPGHVSAQMQMQMKVLLARIRSIEYEASKTKELFDAEERSARFDELTNLPNRKAYNEQIHHELKRYKRYRRPLVLAVLDIDAFRQVNEQFGRQVGDKALQMLVRVLKYKLRGVDYVSRIEGQLFAIIMPETNEEQAFVVLNKIRTSISRIPFKCHKQPFQLTVSIGITTVVADDSKVSALSRAEKALYTAQRSGKDCVRMERKRLLPFKEQSPSKQVKMSGTLSKTGTASSISFHRL